MKVERDFLLDPALALYLPFYKLDGAKIMSNDAHGFLATVSGAHWTIQGRSFDEIDNVITISDHVLLSNNTTYFSISGWFKTGNVDNQANVYDHVIWTKETATAKSLFLSVRGRADATDKGKLFFFILDKWTVKSPTRYDDNNWHCFTVSADRVTYARVMVDGVNVASTDISSYSADDYTGTGNVGIGATILLTNIYNGLIGEIARHNKAINESEHQDYSLATRWRYQ